jgi:hypothetical protein
MTGLKTQESLQFNLRVYMCVNISVEDKQEDNKVVVN